MSRMKKDFAENVTSAADIYVGIFHDAGNYSHENLMRMKESFAGPQVYEPGASSLTL